MVVHELAALSVPFQASSLLHLRRAILAGKRKGLPPTISRNLSKIVSKMLSQNPCKRPSAQNILEFSEVKRRRSFHEQNERSEDKVKLLSTIQVPKTPEDVKKLSDKLSSMSCRSSPEESPPKNKLPSLKSNDNRLAQINLVRPIDPANQRKKYPARSLSYKGADEKLHASEIDDWHVHKAKPRFIPKLNPIQAEPNNLPRGWKKVSDSINSYI